jgi:hypothetical protein
MISLSCPTTSNVGKKGGFKMEEWLKSLPPEEQLNQIMARAAVMTIGYPLNGVDSSIYGGGVAPGECRISLIYETFQPRQEEIIFGIKREDLVSLEIQTKEGEAKVFPFDEIRSDSRVISLFNSVVEGRRIETCNFRPLGEKVRLSLWLDDGSKIRFNTLRGPDGFPRGRVIIKGWRSGQGQHIEELPFPGTETRVFPLAQQG